jgi:hypothetical protein
MDEVIHGQPPYRYIFKDFDYQAFVNWKHFSIPTSGILDKFVYLLEYRDLLLFSQGYQYIRTKSIEDLAAAAAEEADDASGVTKEILTSFLEEFQTPERIEVVWEECDIDHDGNMTLTEYILCRGACICGDAYGNPSDVDQYDLRANGLIEEFEGLMRSMLRPKANRYLILADYFVLYTDISYPNLLSRTILSS